LNRLRLRHNNTWRWRGAITAAALFIREGTMSGRHARMDSPMPTGRHALRAAPATTSRTDRTVPASRPATVPTSAGLAPPDSGIRWPALDPDAHRRDEPATVRRRPVHWRAGTPPPPGPAAQAITDLVVLERYLTGLRALRFTAAQTGGERNRGTSEGPPQRRRPQRDTGELGTSTTRRNLIDHGVADTQTTGPIWGLDALMLGAREQTRLGRSA
jgi:hypothetical protein